MNVLTEAFTKYHGNGNDFIIFDFTAEGNEVSCQQIIAQAKKLCHRHQGIGGDGVIILTAALDTFLMTVINADGSVAQNCGNGLRCAARYLINTSVAASPLTIRLGVRSFICTKIGDEISVAMGEASLNARDQICLGDEFGQAQCAIGHIGNDHLVYFLDQRVVDYDLLLSRVMANINHAHDFNIGFVSWAENGDVISRVYERGAGWTASCGTGASIAALFMTWLFPAIKNTLTISQPGGPLKVSISAITRSSQDISASIVQQGKAEEVFRGICQVMDNC